MDRPTSKLKVVIFIIFFLEVVIRRQEGVFLIHHVLKLIEEIIINLAILLLTHLLLIYLLGVPPDALVSIVRLPLHKGILILIDLFLHELKVAVLVILRYTLEVIEDF